MSILENGESTEHVSEFSIAGGSRVWLAGHHLEAKRLLAPYLLHAIRPQTGLVDVAIVAPVTRDEAIYFARKIIERITADSRLWVVHTGQIHPQRSADIPGFEALIEGLAMLGYEYVTRASLGTGFEMVGFRRTS